MKYILVTDLDGTLLDQHERIHPDDLAILNHLPDDVVFIPASGRSLHSIKHMFSSNGFSPTTPFPFPVITLNGSMGYLPGELELFFHQLDAEIISNVLTIVKEYPEICFLFLDQKNAYMVNETMFGQLGERRYKFGALQFNDQIPLDHFAKIMCLSDDTKSLKRFQRRVSTLPATYAFSMETIFEITPPQVNKGSALRQILQVLGDAEIKILVAGDGENDIDMLRIADINFTSSESPEKIKKEAMVIFEQGKGLLRCMLDQVDHSRNSQ